MASGGNQRLPERHLGALFHFVRCRRFVLQHQLVNELLERLDVGLVARANGVHLHVRGR